MAERDFVDFKNIGSGIENSDGSFYFLSNPNFSKRKMFGIHLDLRLTGHGEMDWNLNCFSKRIIGPVGHDRFFGTSN